MLTPGRHVWDPGPGMSQLANVDSDLKDVGAAQMARPGPARPGRNDETGRGCKRYALTLLPNASEIFTASHTHAGLDMGLGDDCQVHWGGGAPGSATSNNPN